MRMSVPDSSDKNQNVSIWSSRACNSSKAARCFTKRVRLKAITSVVLTRWCVPTMWDGNSPVDEFRNHWTRDAELLGSLSCRHFCGKSPNRHSVAVGDSTEHLLDQGHQVRGYGCGRFVAHLKMDDINFATHLVKGIARMVTLTSARQDRCPWSGHCCRHGILSFQKPIHRSYRPSIVPLLGRSPGGLGATRHHLPKR